MTRRPPPNTAKAKMPFLVEFNYCNSLLSSKIRHEMNAPTACNLRVRKVYRNPDGVHEKRRLARLAARPLGNSAQRATRRRDTMVV